MSREASYGPYDGFPVIEETRIGDWVYGTISDFIYSDTYPDDWEFGDGFVQAPDGSRAGIVWGPDEEDGSEVVPPEEKRWGVYAYRFARPVKTVEDMVFNFRAILPDLQRKYAKQDDVSETRSKNMAIPKRGSRNIVVDGEAYRWYVRRKPTYDQGLCEGFMSFAVEHAEANGSVLMVTLPQYHPGNWMSAEIVPIVPAEVARCVQLALARGWQPKQPGKTFPLDATQIDSESAGSHA